MPKLAPGAVLRTSPAEPSREALDQLLGVVAERTGVDLRGQRAPMLARRAAVRLAATRAPSTEEYLARLRGDLAEPWALLERLTIKVSRLFRDPVAFEILRERAIPELRRARGDRPLRAWSAGCAYGQEAYGLAMLLAGSGGPWSVLATDVDRSALTRARAGRYPRAQASDVPADLARRWLEWCGDADVRVVPALAGGVRFAAHDLGSPTPPPDAGPFDLVACRNVLIYFLARTQGEVLSRVVDRVAPGGWLLLGEAEWPPAAVERRLEVVDRARRLFRVPDAGHRRH